MVAHSFRSCAFAITVGIAVLASGATDAAEPIRIWVDLNGKFSVEARLIEVTDSEVILLRGDGGRVTVPTEQLSEQDQDYLADVAERAAQKDNPLRTTAPEPPEIQPLPALQLPPAREEATAGSPLDLQTPLTPELSKELPKPLAADRSRYSYAASEARIPIEKVDIYDDCSRPIPLTTLTGSGTPVTSVVMSTGNGIRVRGTEPKNQLVRFDLASQQAFVVFKHDDRIRLLDHHDASGRSLVMIDYNSLGRGGQIAVVSGWNDGKISLSQHRKLVGEAETVTADASQVRWARWVDEEHFLAVIDRTLGLWNIKSGEQIYRIDGIDHRAVPALSGGGRYVAVPYTGAVQLLSTEDGRSLGRIGVEKQIPGVCFSPLGNMLAIVTSRKLRNWDLPSASLSADIESRTSLGTGTPVWVDSDLVMSSAGVLLSSFRGLPVWQYDLAATESVVVGEHVAMFHKLPGSELAVIALPHPGAKNALGWIDSRPAEVDLTKWRLMGRSVWSTAGWSDRDVQVQVSALPINTRR
jgi:SLA1 homology domain 1, SHD1